MTWREKCIPALIAAQVFLSPQHFSRFEEIFHILKDRPFFNRGVCKCAFMASMDQERYNQFKDIMEYMISEKAVTASYLIKWRKKHLANLYDANEKTLCKLTIQFLEYPDTTPSESFILELSSAWIPIGDSTLEASYVIDAL